jgi:N-acetylglucosamine-6-phosphate deacetylase
MVMRNGERKEERNGKPGETVVCGKEVFSGAAIAVTIKEGIIVRVDELPDVRKDLLSWIGPGLVDLQINGYAGDDFNTIPFARERLHRVTRALWREGVTTYMPTVITNGDEAILQAVSTIAAACDEDAETNAGVAGIHLEGPFLSPEDGPRGAHDRAYVKAPDWELFQRWQEAAGGRIRLVTLSPEWPGACEFIGRCAEAGVGVSIGHTAASPEQIRDAVRAGARMSTHLGNGAHLMLPRHPNYIWEQLALDDLHACVIADGFHLPESVLKVMLRAKRGKAMLVSDAVSLCGMPPGEYANHIGGNVVLTPEGRLHLKENPKLLAGSARMLRHGIAHLARMGIAGLPEAYEMASLRPSRFMGLPSAAGIAPGAPADLILFDWDENRIHIRATYRSGKPVYQHHAFTEVKNEHDDTGNDSIFA